MVIRQSYTTGRLELRQTSSTQIRTNLDNSFELQSASDQAQKQKIMLRVKSPVSTAVSGAATTPSFFHDRHYINGSTNIPSASSHSPVREPHQQWHQAEKVNIMKDHRTWPKAQGDKCGLQTEGYHSPCISFPMYTVWYKHGFYTQGYHSIYYDILWLQSGWCSSICIRLNGDSWARQSADIGGVASWILRSLFLLLFLQRKKVYSELWMGFLLKGLEIHKLTRNPGPLSLN